MGNIGNQGAFRISGDISSFRDEALASLAFNVQTDNNGSDEDSLENCAFV